MGNSETWRTLCKQAEKALAAGQRGEARNLARKAAKLAPDKVEPWLLLASLATSPASQAYIKRAIANNPRILRAISTIRWAEKSGAALDRKPIQVAIFAKPVSLGLLSLLGLTAIVAIFSWLLRPQGVDESLGLISASAGQQLNELLGSEITEPSATFTATFTPFATRTVLPTNTPTNTATPRATLAPSATSAPETELEMVIDKFDVQWPRDLEQDERWIDINLSEQTLSAFEGTQLVNTFIISSGRPATPTLTGEFSVWVKVRTQTMSGPGYRLENVPWVMYFFGDYGIHGTWWHDNFGTPMSAGCVNMRTPDAEWMYRWASVGTTVVVHY